MVGVTISGKRVPLEDRWECRRKEDAVSSGADRSA